MHIPNGVWVFEVYPFDRILTDYNNEHPYKRYKTNKCTSTQM